MMAKGRIKSGRSRSGGQGARKVLRRRRQRLDLDRALIVGNTSLPSIVYGYRFPSHPRRIKIGYSSRGLTRVVEQSTGFPEKPVIEFVIHDRRAREIEASFHASLKASQSDVIGTEWFDATPDDVLAVSPSLRKALGRGRFVRGVRIVLSVVLVALGVILLPATAALVAAGSTGNSLGAMAGEAGRYMEMLAAPDPEAAARQGRGLLTWAWSRQMPAWPHLLAGVHLPLLAYLPFIRTRPQAF